MEDIVIAGAGGFARETRWLIERINSKEKRWNFCGYIDRKTDKADVIGDDSFLLDRCERLSVAVAVGDPRLRMRLYEQYRKNALLQFPDLIDPSVKMSESVRTGMGNIICADCVLTVDIRIGDLNIINLGCTIGHDVRIGHFNTLDPGVNVSGNVHIGDLTDIGTGTKIIQGKTIGSRSVTGAGAVVIRDIPCDVLAVGVPAAVKKIFDDSSR